MRDDKLPKRSIFKVIYRIAHFKTTISHFSDCLTVMLSFNLLTACEREEKSTSFLLATVNKVITTRDDDATVKQWEKREMIVLK